MSGRHGPRVPARIDRRLLPPLKAWIEWSSDCREVLATYATRKEALADKGPESIIAGPYHLAATASRRA